MASGGNDTKQVADALAWEALPLRMYEAIFSHIRSQGKLFVSPERRLYEIGRPENDNAPF
jgi:hypothetical protein